MGISGNTHTYKKRPENLVVEMMNTAETHFDEGNFIFAIKYYSEVIALEPAPADLTYALYMRGMAYQKTGRNKLAKADWQQVKNLDFTHPLGIDLSELGMAS